MKWKENKKQPTRPAPAANTADPCPPYAKVVGLPGTGSYPAPSPDPTTHDTDAEGIVVIGTVVVGRFAVGLWACLG